MLSGVSPPKRKLQLTAIGALRSGSLIFGDMKTSTWGLLWFTLLMHSMCEPPREPVCESLWELFNETKSNRVRFDALDKYEDLDCDELPYPPSRRDR